MNFSHFFINRPIFAGVLSIADFRHRACSRCSSCRSANIPKSCRRRSSCARLIPARIPKTIAETVASPLEQAINGVEDSLYMFSQATGDGVMTLTVTFKLGTDVDKAQVQVQNRVSQALPKLPEEVRRLGVTTTKQSPDLTMVVHLFSPNGRYDEVYLRNYATLAGEGRARAHSRRGRRAKCSAPAITRCASGSTRTKSPRAISPPAMSSPPFANKTCRSPPAPSASSRSVSPVNFEYAGQRQGPSDFRRRNSATSSSRPGRTAKRRCSRMSRASN